jgi:thioredoxin
MAVEHANDENYSEIVEKSDIPVVVDFWASWCGPCQMFGPIFEETSKDFEGKVKFVKVSTEDAQEVAGKMNIMSIPTIVFMKNGKEVQRISGLMQKQQLSEQINKML